VWTKENARKLTAGLLDDVIHFAVYVMQRRQIEQAASKA
jgi:hypothetical protein